MAEVEDLRELITGEGKHQGHARVQRGTTMFCSCGATARVRLTPKPRLAVQLADGFISWRGTDPERAAEVAGRHEGAIVVDLGPLMPRRA